MSINSWTQSINRRTTDIVAWGAFSSSLRSVYLLLGVLSLDLFFGFQKRLLVLLFDLLFLLEGVRDAVEIVQSQAIGGHVGNFGLL